MFVNSFNPGTNTNVENVNDFIYIKALTHFNCGLFVNGLESLVDPHSKFKDMNMINSVLGLMFIISTF